MTTLVVCKRPSGGLSCLEYLGSTHAWQKVRIPIQMHLKVTVAKSWLKEYAFSKIWTIEYTLVEVMNYQVAIFACNELLKFSASRGERVV